MSEIKSFGRLASTPGLDLLPQSLAEGDGLEFGLASRDGEYQLLVLAETGCQHLAGFEGNLSTYESGLTLLTGPTSSRNLGVLQHHLPWLRPQILRLRTSVGLGDRLGLATPGHVRALRAAGGELAPIFAQQSIREMERTGRSAKQVMEDAVWGVFAEGWRWGFGADADHLKTPEDIDLCLAAGYTFFTFDPGEYVDGSAGSADLSALRGAVERLPWTQLEDSAEAMGDRYLSKCFGFEGHEVGFDEKTLYGAAVKYGRAVAHVAAMYRHLARAVEGRDFEVEISVDETETPTTHAQHVYIASELRRLGVEWVSLAPRYIGQFEKGVDYIGDIGEFEADFALHASIARHFGPYKLSLHSGSDKFSIYPAAVRQARGMVHLKTAGTSYLEALRTVATLNPELFREIYAFSRDRYEKDRASYHVSASLKRAPSPKSVSDANLSSLLDQFDAREIMHVTFGSVLTARSEEGGWRFYDRFMDTLRAGSTAYATNLERHFLRHMRPFVESRVAAEVKSRGRAEMARSVEVPRGSSGRQPDLQGKVAMVTGGTGVLGGAMARGLAESGARVGILGRREEKARRVASEIEESGGQALALPADVLDREQLEKARRAALELWGRVDILVNAAGGNVPEATLREGTDVFGLPQEAVRQVFDLNFLGTLLPSQVFGEAMVGWESGGRSGRGCIVNISSMAASQPLTNVVGYSATKAAVNNLTRWLAVELARKYGPGMRVNAIAPGFFVGEQNRALLLEEDGSLTERGRTIIDHTPAGRFGEPEELVGTLVWLCSSASEFVNGIVVPVDGGFSAFSGV